MLELFPGAGLDFPGAGLDLPLPDGVGEGTEGVNIPGGGSFLDGVDGSFLAGVSGSFFTFKDSVAVCGDGASKSYGETCWKHTLT